MCEKPLLLYDEVGNLVNQQVFKVGAKLRKEVEALYLDLLDRGMTIIEGRALKDYIHGEIDISSTLQMMAHSCGVKLEDVRKGKVGK